MSIVESLTAPSRKRAFPLKAALHAFRRNLRAVFFDDYHPELHYMRGPGPKWREKHDAASRTTAQSAVGSFHQATA